MLGRKKCGLWSHTDVHRLPARPLTSLAGPSATRGPVRLDHVHCSSILITGIPLPGKPASWALS